MVNFPGPASNAGDLPPLAAGNGTRTCPLCTASSEAVASPAAPSDPGSTELGLLSAFVGLWEYHGSDRS